MSRYVLLGTGKRKKGGLGKEDQKGNVKGKEENVKRVGGSDCQVPSDLRNCIISSI